MPIKIKRSQRKLIALTLAEKAKPIFFRLLNKFIKEEVINSITSGRSPVGGTRARYDKYSTSYVEAMGSGELKQKKQRPVNLTLTGKMLKSIKSKKYKDYVRVWFEDEKAKYHDKLGAGKSKVIRRMMPHTGEQFNAGIRRRIANALREAIKLSKK